MEIIRATERHIPEIVELWKEFMDHHRDIDPRFPMREDAPTGFEKHLIEFMSLRDTLVLVALFKNRTVGFPMSRINNCPPIWERKSYGAIDSIAVQSDYRHRGIGEQMLAAIYEWFKSHNVDRIELSVAAKNQVGYSFWKKHGFKVCMHRLYLDRG